MTESETLDQRQQRLLARSAALRATLAAQSVVLVTPLALADRVHSGALWAYRQRGWFALGGVVFLVVRPQRVLKLASFGWWLWRSARHVQPWLVAAGLAARPAS